MAKSDFLALCHQVQMARRDANRGESDPGSDPSRIGSDHVREAWVSTVWLGIDLGYWGWGPPIIFETMIFGGEHRQLVRAVRDEGSCASWARASCCRAEKRGRTVRN